MQLDLSRSADCRRKAASPWLGSMALAMAMGVTYFLAAQLSLELLSMPAGVAVFWPAAGIAAGTLIALGPTARWPVIAGVMGATMAANLTGDRNLASAVVFSLSNAGEAALIAWLIEHHFGSDFSLDALGRVLGFFLATAVATAVSGIAATAGFALFHPSEASLLTVWMNWLASDAIGVVTVAPLMIGLIRILPAPANRPELLEGVASLAVLAAVSTFSFGSNYLFTVLPLGLLLPLLIWPAARCPPVFAAAAVFIVSLVIVVTMTLGIGRLGDPNIALSSRVQAAQVALLGISTCALVLAALCADMRSQREVLKEHADRLQLALDGAELGVWSIDLKTGRHDNDARDQQIHTHHADAPPRTLREARHFIHPDDLPNLDAAFSTSKHAGKSLKAEYRLAPSAGLEHAGPERWVAVEGMVMRNPSGQPVRLLGVTRDITERKQTEEQLRDSERELRKLLGALPAAVYVTDAAGRITYFNAAAVELWGVRPELGRSCFCGSWKLYRADGTPMEHHECPMAVALTHKRPIRDAEAIAERPDGTRVPFIPFPTPLFDASGALTGGINMLVDISARKQAEVALAERNAQLALAGKMVLVGTFTFDVDFGANASLARLCRHPWFGRGDGRIYPRRVVGQSSPR